MKTIARYITVLLVLFKLSAEAQDLNNIKKTGAFRMSGSISLGSFFYNANGIDSRQQPFGYTFGVNLNFSIYGVSIPFYASFNEQGTAFQHPFNRYGISPHYKWIKAHIGWRSMSMSQFTLSNTTFLGGGLELTPDKFRFGVMYGNLKQPAALQNINYDKPQFERKAMAVKIGYGTNNNFIDFIVFKAKDDTNSLMMPDSILNNIPAYENLVLGIKNQLSMMKNSLVFNFDASFSAFSHNIRYPYTGFFGDDKYTWVKSIYNPNISTSFNYAGETGLTYHRKYYSIGAKYRRVMPDFKTLGSEYILSDLEAVTLNPSVNFFNGKAILAGSIGTQHNNLDGMRTSTNRRLISSVNLNLNPSPYYGINLGYSNYTFRQQVIIDSLYNDSLVVNQLNHNFNVMPRYNVNKENYIHNLILTINYQILNDKNDVTTDLQSNNMLLGNLIYSLTLKKSKINIRAGATYFRFVSGLIAINRMGVNVGVSRKFLKRKLRAGANISYNKQNETYGNSVFLTTNVNLNYQMFKKTRISLRFYYNNTNTTRRKYNEERIQFRISQAF